MTTDAEAVVDDTTPEEPARHAPPRHHRRLRRRRAVVLAGIAVLTLVGVGLGAAGLSAVRNSTVGRYEATAGPTEPGYRASLVPSPTLGVLLTADDGSLVGAAVLALTPDDTSGAVVLVPPAVIVGDAGPSAGDHTTLADVYDDGGADTAAAALAGVLTAAIDHTVVIDAATWEQLLEPVGAIEVTLRKPVANWDAGQVRLRPDQVGSYLAALDDGEDDLARMSRQQDFWQAWLAAVQDGGDSSLPGEIESGIGRFIRVIAAGDGTAEGLPVVRVDDAETPADSTFAVDQGRLQPFVAGAIPYPTAPEPGARIRVRLLNGSGDRGMLTRAASALVAAGAEIVVVGNPDPLDQPETLYVPATDTAEPSAEWLQALVGGGRIELVPPESSAGAAGDEIDVTVILGQDAEDIFGREQTSD